MGVKEGDLILTGYKVCKDCLGIWRYFSGPGIQQLIVFFLTYICPENYWSICGFLDPFPVTLSPISPALYLSAHYLSPILSPNYLILQTETSVRLLSLLSYPLSDGSRGHLIISRHYLRKTSSETVDSNNTLLTSA